MRPLPTTVSVGIMAGQSVGIVFHGRWKADGGGVVADTEQTVTAPCSFAPLEPACSFTLRAVTIGRQYHWERQEDQTFTGRLAVIREGGGLTAVNTLPIEDYLVSVISSEMSATAGLEFLKASAVISRSWLVNMIERARAGKDPSDAGASRGQMDEGHLITWFDHEDHDLYDVCADDHCQRYQGITRVTHPNVREAVESTRHQVLTYRDEVCDCRFSKCCGGHTEDFATCWEDRHVPYLQAHPDSDPVDSTILCDTRDGEILAQVLNSYDRETTDFYRWQVELSQQQISGLMARKLGCDLGQIVELRPLRRGASGRIFQLLVRGTRRQMVIGKELVIRGALSETHLYSSAFDIEAEGDGPVPDRFVLRGKGWGHGVGMCQIGAAVMASKGYTYRQILNHYYPGATLHTYNINHK